LAKVRIGALSETCMKWVGLTPPQVTSKTMLSDSEELARLLSGSQLFEGSDPISHCYCGHQFGYFSGQLGDGRAISLGDVVGADK